MKIVCAFLVLVFASLSSFADERINSGGSTTGGFSADRYYSGGTAKQLSGSTGVYRSERQSSGTFRYNIPVAPGNYRVSLYFRESCYWCGYFWPERIFDVRAEGQVVADDVQFERGQEVVRSFDVVADSMLNLVFVTVQYQAYVNAIEVVPIGGGPPAPTPAPTIQISASPASINAGDTSLITWNATDATSCTASNGWSGQQPTSGSYAVTPTANTSYALTCVGPGGTSEEAVASVAIQQTPPNSSGPSLLHVSTKNSRYFANAEDEIVLLSGSHSWFKLVDHGWSNPPPAENYQSFLNFVADRGHNFFKLWAWEQPRWAPFDASNNFWLSPTPYVRSGPGNARDGLPKFDLDRFNQAYFDRLRARVVAAGDRGFYVSVMLFNGWSLGVKGSTNLNNPWKSHPMNAANNINGINGDPNSDGYGYEVQTLSNNSILQLQKKYVAKVIDTVNDLDNVLYEISNESESNSQAWQYEMIAYIKSYEASKAKQHPVGMTVEFPGGNNNELLQSSADWISMNGSVKSPPRATGTKVILSDTDHLCGTCGTREWVWKSFTRGENPIFMDVFDAYQPGKVDTSADWTDIRKSLGFIQTVAQEFDLAGMPPQTSTSICSSGYCLASGNRKQFIAYLPSGRRIGLSLPSGSFRATWLNPATGGRSDGGTQNGGGTRYFNNPFSGDAVLLVK